MFPIYFTASSGSLTVNPDGTVHILAEEACELSDLDPSVSQIVMPLWAIC
jgi:hypothetical protein